MAATPARSRSQWLVADANAGDIAPENGVLLAGLSQRQAAAADRLDDIEQQGSEAGP